MERLATGYGLIEGPLWLPDRGLVFSDVLNGGVFCLGRDGRVTTVFEHRRGVGGIALHVAGGLIVSGRNISYKPFDGGPTVTVLDRDPDAGNVGYNDLTTDAAGRIYAGSLGVSPVFENDGNPAAGDLWLVDLDGTSRVVGREIWLTNGLGFAPDGRTLYHSDSRIQTVWRYAVEPDGSLGPKAVFARTSRGVPDGLVVSVDGAVWVALAGGGHGVAVFDANGVQRDFLETPEPMCTSVCFGGDDLQDLYVVTGSDGSGRADAGSVYRHRVDVAGVPVAPARVSLPSPAGGREPAATSR
jgi:xylono-1,5-lactonase